MECFIPLEINEKSIVLPKTFTYPFYYQPDELAKLAVSDLQKRIESQNWEHNFGLIPNQKGLVIGKMFGVLIVKNKNGILGYLAAFSGKVAESNHHDSFVPPVFDMLKKNSFFKKEEAVINEINNQIEAIENSEAYLKAKSKFISRKQKIETKLKARRVELKTLKKERKTRKIKALKTNNETFFNQVTEQLKKESLSQQAFYKVLARRWQTILNHYEKEYTVYTRQIDVLKDERKKRSARLQNKLFEQYTFKNINGVSKSLKQIFEATIFKIPAAGAGECAAPKLLQYAFLNNLTPISMAEFWWGASPKSQIRKHKAYYPACRSKCEPILGHMLEGMKVTPNPMLENPAKGKRFEIVYEDAAIIVINKPAEFLSVPGKNISDSVYTRVKAMYPEAHGPLIVHRLDMSTSGLMVLAKTKSAHQFIQQQFINKTVQKRYTALLNGIPKLKEGEINLPLRVDLDNRPMQLVCYEHGKTAITKWKIAEIKNNKTRVHFYPITGRTHQLRVHAAHHTGLNCPIVGDDLYGEVSNRLHLHAGYLQIIHPVKKTYIEFTSEADF
ncbi:MAG: pseudouridine synthase [Flavobacteriaceae bacterium]